MKNLDEALKIHFQMMTIGSSTSIPQLPDGVTMEELEARVQSWCVAHIPATSPQRGRPPAPFTGSERTNDSYHAAQLVLEQLLVFRERNNLKKRVPARATEAFIEYAKQLYPKADDHIVAEYLRENKKYFPKDRKSRTLSI